MDTLRTYPKKLIECFVKNAPRLLERKYLLQIFTAVLNRPTVVLKEGQKLTQNTDVYYAQYDKDITVGDIVLVKENDNTTKAMFQVFDITENEHITLVLITLNKEYFNRAPFGIQDTFELTKNMIENFTGESIITSFGRYTLNYHVFVTPFKEKNEYPVPYINKIWHQKEIINDIGSNLIMQGKMSHEEYKKFKDQAYFIGHFSELNVPAYSEKALGTDPRVKQRLKELLEQYKDQLHDPNVLAKIEDELIAIDKEWLKDDVSMGFLASEGRSFTVLRKKLFLTGGMVEKLGSNGSEYDFIENSLSDGWDRDAFAIYANENRSGINNRAINTAKGGETAKILVRVLQHLKITEDDCGTKRGIKVFITKDNTKRWIGHTIIEKDNSLVILTDDTIKKYINKEVLMRTSLYCTAKNDGFCFTCLDNIFKQLLYKSLGTLSMVIGTSIMNLSMKAMHGTKVSSTDIDDFFQYFI